MSCFVAPHVTMRYAEPMMHAGCSIVRRRRVCRCICTIPRNGLAVDGINLCARLCVFNPTVRRICAYSIQSGNVLKGEKFGV